MILYLVGIVVLLWTLDDVVAIVVTVTVAVFLGAASAFTILPLLCKRCPYKSPTSWALCVAWDVGCAAYNYLRSVWKVYTGHSHLSSLPAWWRFKFTLQSVKWPGRRRNWRERDAAACGAFQPGEGNPGLKSMRKTAKLELAREEGHLFTNNSLLWPRPPFYSDIRRAVKHISRNAADIFLTDLSETALLWRALSWMRKTSQDTRVSKYIDQCIGSIHFNSDAFGIYYGAHTLTNWCITSSLISGSTLQPHAALVHEECPQNPSNLTHLRNALRIQATHLDSQSPSSVGRFMFSIDDQPGPMRLLGPVQSGPELEILLRILCSDLGSFMEHLQAMVDTDEAITRREDFGIHVRRVFELTSALTRLASYAQSPFLAGSQYAAGLYAIISSGQKLKQELETQAPGLRLIAFRLACRYGKVSMHDVDGENVFGK